MRRGPNVNWFVLLGIFLPVFVAAALLAFYPSGWSAFTILAALFVFLIAMLVTGLIRVFRKDDGRPPTQGLGRDSS